MIMDVVDLTSHTGKEFGYQTSHALDIFHHANFQSREYHFVMTISLLALDSAKS